MADGVSYYKLSSIDDSFELAKYYKEMCRAKGSENVEMFPIYIKYLEELSEKLFDFDWLIENAKKYDFKKNELFRICDGVCIELGKTIENICNYSREPVVVEQKDMGKNCPFHDKAIVVYGRYSGPIKIDGKFYNIVDTREEDGDYYRIYCNSIDN